MFYWQWSSFRYRYLVGWNTGENPDYIHLCKCWSHICSGKVIKKSRNTRFLLQIILFFPSADWKDSNVFSQGMPWLFCKICRMSLHACHAVKTLSRKYSKIQQYLRKSLKIPWLYHMFVFQMPAEFSKIHGLNRLQIMLYGNCFNSPSLKYFDHF